MKLFRSKVKIPTQDKIEIESVDMFVVSWWRRYGKFNSDLEKCYRSFFTEDDAILFKNALDEANKLIGNTSNTRVEISRQIVN